MNKDERYEIVKDMIEAGKVTEFRQIFKYVPKTVLAHDLSTNTTRMTRMIDDVQEFSVKEIFIIAELIEVDHSVIYRLIAKQHINSPAAKA